MALALIDPHQGGQDETLVVELLVLRLFLQPHHHRKEFGVEVQVLFPRDEARLWQLPQPHHDHQVPDHGQTSFLKQPEAGTSPTTRDIE